MSVAFGGEVRDSGPCASVTLTDLIGTRTGHLRNLRVLAGTGLGGRVMVDSRPAGVEDYGVARGITHDYDLPVLAEGLCTVVAAPVVVAGRPRAVVYVASRERGSIGDRVRSAVTGAAGRMAAELTIRDEVDRRLAMLEAAATTQRPDIHDVADLEEVRAVHSDLRLIAQDLEDEQLRARVQAASSRLAALGSTWRHLTAVRLSAREIDVLAQVALGCSNTEAARRMSVRPETAKGYLRSAMRKLDAHTRHEAVVRSRALGLLP